MILIQAIFSPKNQAGYFGNPKMGVQILDKKYCPRKLGGAKKLRA
jgi:hypothetical protein